MLQWLIFSLMPVLQLIGVYAGIHFYTRMRTDTTATRNIWLILTSIIGGASGFTSHLMTLAAMPPGSLFYWDSMRLTISFIIGLSCIGLAIHLSGRLRWPYSTLTFAGVFYAICSFGTFGVLLTAEVQGTLTFDRTYIAAALIVSFFMAVLGGHIAETAVSMRKVAVGAAALGFLTPVQDILTLAGATVVLDANAPKPSGLNMNATLIFGLIFGTLVVSSVGGAGLLLDRHLEKEAARRYRKLALADALTGLLNRIGLYQALETAFHIGKRARMGHIMFVIDLDKFKPINDTFGHAAGDHVLVVVARRLQETLPEDAVMGRVGGDEFIAFQSIPLGEISEHRALELGDKLIRSLQRPITFNSSTMNVGASIGVSLSPRDADSPEGLINAADIALYDAKERRGQVIPYRPEMGTAVRKRTELEADIRRALFENEFILRFQPQVNLTTNRPVGFEALIRWQHPKHGLLMPAEFIPFAEESALISEIGFWVLQQACDIAVTWPKSYHIAINVAARQLAMPGFVEQVQDALFHSGLDAKRLEIELTEASVIKDQEQALKVMHKLRALGVRLAMDDYGTGYASLAALRTFPFDKLKIDRSFISGLSEDSQSVAIVRSTLLLTDALCIPVVAEGVETQHHVDFLMKEGCCEVQGYFYGKPMPLAEVHEIISQDQTFERKQAG